MARPLKVSMVRSTQLLSLSVSVWIVTATSCSSATERQQSMAAGVVPQSSCSLRPTAPAAMMSCRPSGLELLPLPVKAKLSGRSSVACSIMRMCSGPGVHVVAQVPLAGPVPPPSRLVMPLAMASSQICGQMKCTCASIAPAVRIIPSPAMASVLTPHTSAGSTPSITSGLPALPSPTMRPPFMPTSVLNTPVKSSTNTLVITVSSVCADVRPTAIPIPSRSVLPPPKVHSSPGHVRRRSRSTRSVRAVSPSRTRSPSDGPYIAAYSSWLMLKSKSEPGSAIPQGALGSGVWRKPRASARSRAAAALAGVSAPSARPLPPRPTLLPPTSTSTTVFSSPGSKRTAVPAAMCRRRPYACARSNSSQLLASKK
mmetsp:Transcript_882/g.3440  ORF Transcript_882/g.3440 Transcript_882/m.3440 type:complete len:370 (+) Transcript_882:3219-4328(+)